MVATGRAIRFSVCLAPQSAQAAMFRPGALPAQPGFSSSMDYVLLLALKILNLLGLLRLSWTISSFYSSTESLETGNGYLFFATCSTLMNCGFTCTTTMTTVLPWTLSFRPCSFLKTKRIIWLSKKQLKRFMKRLEPASKPFSTRLTPSLTTRAAPTEFGKAEGQLSCQPATSFSLSTYSSWS